MFDGLDIETRSCEKCGKLKILEEFPLHDKGRPSRRWTCQVCMTAIAAERREAMKLKPRDAVESKFCKGCSRTKSASEFSHSGAERDGLASKCKLCVAEYQKERRELLKASHLCNVVVEKTCIGCGETKPADAFSRSKVVSDGLYGQCKTCCLKDQKEARETAIRENPKPVKARTMFHCATGRAKRLGLPIDIDEDYVMSILSDVCPALGTPICYDNRGKLQDNSPTLDKFYAKRGYTKGNIFVISHLANRMKSSATATQVRAVADWMTRVEGLRSRGNNYIDKVPFGIPVTINAETTNKAKALLSSASHRARERHLPFDLDPEYILSIALDVCPALGIPLNYGACGSLKDDSPNLDRFDPTKGYTKGNVFIISRLANTIKNEANATQVTAVANWMEKVEAELLNSKL